jgi:hypothetical protein
VLLNKSQKPIKSHSFGTMPVRNAPKLSSESPTVQSRLAGLFSRVSWRPAGTASAESITAGITNFTSSLSAAAQNLGWRFPSVCRRRPWPGWSRLWLSFEPAPDSRGLSLPYLPTGQRHDVFSLPISPDKEPARQLNNVQVPSGQALPVVESETENSTHHSRSVAPFVQVHPGIEMTSTPKVRRQTAGAVGRRIPSADESVSISTLAASPRHTLVAPGSTISRRELPGGFPFGETVLSWLPQSELRSGEPQAKASAVREERPSPTTSAQLLTETPARGSEREGVIQKLIERTIQPTTLAGFQVKLAPQEIDIHRSEKPGHDRVVNADQPKDAVAAVPEATTITALPPSAPVDLNLIASKVYQMLTRRQQLEQERRGLY